jgi:hypothetical protein
MMILKRVLTTLVVCGAFLVAIPLTAGAVPVAGDPACPVPQHHSDVAYLVDPAGRFDYSYQVSWCTVNGAVAGIEPLLTHNESDGTCDWQGPEKDTETLVEGTTEWHAFNMSVLVCETPDGRSEDVYPWAIISVSPGGANYIVDKDIDYPAAGVPV